MAGNPDFDATLGLLLGQDTQTAGWDLFTRESSLGYIIGAGYRRLRLAAAGPEVIVRGFTWCYARLDPGHTGANGGPGLGWLAQRAMAVWVEGGPVMGLPRGTVTFVFTDLGRQAG